MMRPIVDGSADYVNGSRILGEFERESLLRHLGVHLFARIVTVLTGRRITDPSSGYRAARAELLAAVRPRGGSVLDERDPDRGAPASRARGRGPGHDRRAGGRGVQEARAASATAGASRRSSFRPGCADRDRDLGGQASVVLEQGQVGLQRPAVGLLGQRAKQERA